MNAKEARAMLLSGCEPIIKDLLYQAAGKPNLADENHRVGVDKEARKIVIDIIAPMLQQASDTEAINAHSTAEVISALREGQISVDEALKLMQMLVSKAEVDDVREINERLARMDGSFIDSRPNPSGNIYDHED